MARTPAPRAQLAGPFAAHTAALLLEQNGKAPPEIAPRENVDFYLANADKIAALSAEMQAPDREQD